MSKDKYLSVPEGGKMPELTFARERFFNSGLVDTLGKYFDIDHKNYAETPYKYRTSATGMRGFSRAGVFLGEAPWMSLGARASFLTNTWAKAPKALAVALRGARMGIPAFAVMLLGEVAANATGILDSDALKDKIIELSTPKGQRPHPADLSKEPSITKESVNKSEFYKSLHERDNIEIEKRIAMWEADIDQFRGTVYLPYAKKGASIVGGILGLLEYGSQGMVEALIEMEHGIKAGYIIAPVISDYLAFLDTIPGSKAEYEKNYRAGMDPESKNVLHRIFDNTMEHTHSPASSQTADIIGRLAYAAQATGIMDLRTLGEFGDLAGPMTGIVNDFFAPKGLMAWLSISNEKPGIERLPADINRLQGAVTASTFKLMAIKAFGEKQIDWKSFFEFAGSENASAWRQFPELRGVINIPARFAIDMWGNPLYLGIERVVGRVGAVLNRKAVDDFVKVVSDKATSYDHIKVLMGQHVQNIPANPVLIEQVVKLAQAGKATEASNILLAAGAERKTIVSTLADRYPMMRWLKMSVKETDPALISARERIDDALRRNSQLTGVRDTLMDEFRATVKTVMNEEGVDGLMNVVNLTRKDNIVMTRDFLNSDRLNPVLPIGTKMPTPAQEKLIQEIQKVVDADYSLRSTPDIFLGTRAREIADANKSSLEFIAKRDESWRSVVDKEDALSLLKEGSPEYRKAIEDISTEIRRSEVFDDMAKRYDARAVEIGMWDQLPSNPLYSLTIAKEPWKILADRESLSYLGKLRQSRMQKALDAARNGKSVSPLLKYDEAGYMGSVVFTAKQIKKMFPSELMGSMMAWVEKMTARGPAEQLASDLFQADRIVRDTRLSLTSAMSKLPNGANEVSGFKVMDLGLQQMEREIGDGLLHIKSATTADLSRIKMAEIGKEVVGVESSYSTFMKRLDSYLKERGILSEGMTKLSNQKALFNANAAAYGNPFGNPTTAAMLREYDGLRQKMGKVWTSKIEPLMEKLKRGHSVEKSAQMKSLHQELLAIDKSLSPRVDELRSLQNSQGKILQADKLLVEAEATHQSAFTQVDYDSMVSEVKQRYDIQLQRLAERMPADSKTLEKAIKVEYKSLEKAQKQELVSIKKNFKSKIVTEEERSRLLKEADSKHNELKKEAGSDLRDSVSLQNDIDRLELARDKKRDELLSISWDPAEKDAMRIGLENYRSEYNGLKERKLEVENDVISIFEANAKEGGIDIKHVDSLVGHNQQVRFQRDRMSEGVHILAQEAENLEATLPSRILRSKGAWNQKAKFGVIAAMKGFSELTAIDKLLKLFGNLYGIPYTVKNYVSNTAQNMAVLGPSRYLLADHLPNIGLDGRAIMEEVGPASARRFDPTFGSMQDAQSILHMPGSNATILPSPAQTVSNEWVEYTTRNRIKKDAYWSSHKKMEASGVAPEAREELARFQARKASENVQFQDYKPSSMGIVYDRVGKQFARYSASVAKLGVDLAIHKPSIFGAFSGLRQSLKEANVDGNGNPRIGDFIIKVEEALPFMKMAEWASNLQADSNFPYVVTPEVANDKPWDNDAPISQKVEIAASRLSSTLGSAVSNRVTDVGFLQIPTLISGAKNIAEKMLDTEPPKPTWQMVTAKPEEFGYQAKLAKAKQDDAYRNELYPMPGVAVLNKFAQQAGYMNLAEAIGIYKKVGVNIDEVMPTAIRRYRMADLVDNPSAAPIGVNRSVLSPMTVEDAIKGLNLRIERRAGLVENGPSMFFEEQTKGMQTLSKFEQFWNSINIDRKVQIRESALEKFRSGEARAFDVWATMMPLATNKKDVEWVSLKHKYIDNKQPIDSATIEEKKGLWENFKDSLPDETKASLKKLFGDIKNESSLFLDRMLTKGTPTASAAEAKDYPPSEAQRNIDEFKRASQLPVSHDDSRILLMDAIRNFHTAEQSNANADPTLQSELNKRIMDEFNYIEGTIKSGDYGYDRSSAFNIWKNTPDLEEILQAPTRTSNMKAVASFVIHTHVEPELRDRKDKLKLYAQAANRGEDIGAYEKYLAKTNSDKLFGPIVSKLIKTEADNNNASSVNAWKLISSGVPPLAVQTATRNRFATEETATGIGFKNFADDLRGASMQEKRARMKDFYASETPEKVKLFRELLETQAPLLNDDINKALIMDRINAIREEITLRQPVGATEEGAIIYAPVQIDMRRAAVLAANYMGAEVQLALAGVGLDKADKESQQFMSVAQDALNSESESGQTWGAVFKAHAPKPEDIPHIVEHMANVELGVVDPFDIEVSNYFPVLTSEERKNFQIEDSVRLRMEPGGVIQKDIAIDIHSADTSKDIQSAMSFDPNRSSMHTDRTVGKSTVISTERVLPSGRITQGMIDSMPTSNIAQLSAVIAANHVMQLQNNKTGIRPELSNTASQYIVSHPEAQKILQTQATRQEAEAFGMPSNDRMINASGPAGFRYSGGGFSGGGSSGWVGRINASSQNAINSSPIASRIQTTANVASTLLSSYQLLARYGVVDPEKDTVLNHSMDGLGAGLSVFTTIAGIALFTGPAAPVILVVAAVIAIVVGVLTGLGVIGGKKKDNSAEEARTARQREIDAENERRRLDSIRIQSIQQTQSREISIGKALKDPTMRSNVQQKYGPQLAQFKVKPTYGSKVGMVDIIERELSAQLKPRY